MSELIDNRAHRIRVLKEIIQELHRGADPDAVRGTLKSIVRETSSSEIAAMEQELIRSSFRPAPLIEPFLRIDSTASAAAKPRLQDGRRPLGRRLCDLHRRASRRVMTTAMTVRSIGS